MAKLGKIEKPDVSTFSAKRKLYLVPTLPFEDLASQYNIDMVKVERFWGEVREKINYFISTYGKISTIYMEGINEDEKAGLEYFEKTGKDNNHYKLIKSLLESGAVVKGIEISGQMERAKLLFEEYSKSLIPEVLEIHKGFYGKDINFDRWREYLVKKIQETQDEMGKSATRILEESPADSSGLLLITDGRPIEFPDGIDIFQIRPPAFDEIERYIREKVNPINRMSQ
ncbi:MAG: hypothetical protein OIN86_00995 [Candidatus Methanoperedens sp.]|nr:hypothetical protein [Candidatus Methanoperedens sp.]CAG0983630.1 hypothetical protein METP1_01909 [Methanosarcinales archaeon]